MEVFGSFEADDVAREGNFGVVMYARRAGSKDRRFAVKVFRPPELLMDEDQIAAESEQFLEAAEAQQRAHAIAGTAWGPVYEMGRCTGGAWYATDLMQCSLEMLRITQKDLETDHLRRIVESIVQGLLALRTAQGRPHGNLRETNVLLMGREDLSRARIVLCDPRPASRCRGIEDEQRDARDLGNLIHQLVLHRPFQNQTDWPIQSTERWQRMGKAGDQWLELVNRLIDPSKPAKPSLDEIAASMPGPALKLPPKPDPEKQRREEQARQEEARRKQREAQIAQQVQADKQAREERERAERERKERERQEQEKQERERQEREQKERDRLEKERQERERAERERIANERREADAAAAAQKAREAEERRIAEQAAKEQAARDARARQAEEAERKRVEQAAKEQAAREKKEREAREAAERKAEAERAAKQRADQDEARRTAAEQRRQEAPAARAVKETVEGEHTPAATFAPAGEAAPSRAATGNADALRPAEDDRWASSPGKPGGNKKLLIGVGSLVVIGASIGLWKYLRPDPPVPPADPTPQPQPAVSGGPGRDPAGTSGPSVTTNTPSTPQADPPPPTPPTIDQLREVAREQLPAAEKITGELEAAAGERMDKTLTTGEASIRQQLVDTAVANARTADLELSESEVRKNLIDALKLSIKPSLVTAAGAEPKVTDRPGLKSVADEVVKKVTKIKPGGAETDVRSVCEEELQKLVDDGWKAAVDRVATAKAGPFFDKVGNEAVEKGVEEFRKRTDIPPPADEPTQVELDELIDTARSISLALDNGSGGQDFGKAARATLLELGKRKWFDRVAQHEAVTRARARVEFLEAVASADAAAAVTRGQQAASETGGVSEIIAVWNRLGAIETPVDLAQASALRGATLDRAQGLADPAARQAVEKIVNDTSKAMWTTSAAAANSERELDTVQRQQSSMGITAEDVQGSAELVFNFALLDLKKAMRTAGAPGQASVDALKAPAAEFLRKVEPIASALQPQVVADSIGWARAIASLDSSPPAGDLTTSGPGAVGWQCTPGPGGETVEYRLGNATLVFHRIGSVYLSETEVSLAIFLRQNGVGGSFAEIARDCDTSADGLRTWTSNLGKNVASIAANIVNSSLLNRREQREAWSGLKDEALKPAPTWPVHWVGPRAAMVIAGRLGCRLPTEQEWQAAVQADAGASANLRDESFGGVLASARAFQRTQFFPDAGAVIEEGAAAATFAPADGVAFFAPVSSGTGKWKFLRGNVAEWVLTSAPPSGPFPTTLGAVEGLSATFGVAGGSALGPPANADRVIPPVGNKRQYSDVGLRLAFPAPGAGGATPAAVDVQVASLLGAGFL